MTSDDDRALDRSAESGDRTSEDRSSEDRGEKLERRIADQPTVTPGIWVRRAVVVLVLVVVAYVALRISAAFFPRWWAQRVADQVQGRFIAGTSWGLFYGFVFTIVPLLVIFQVRRGFFSWMWRGIVALVAVLLAAPNWLTLAVVAGNSKAAHAGERIMDVDAPNFRVATLIGAIAAAVLAVVITGASMQMKRRKEQVKQLRTERDELRAGQKEAGGA